MKLTRRQLKPASINNCAPWLFQCSREHALRRIGPISEVIHSRLHGLPFSIKVTPSIEIEKTCHRGKSLVNFKVDPDHWLTMPT